MKDKISQDRLLKVHPVMQQRVTAFFDALEKKGLTPRIVQGLRTIEEQNTLYAQGRTKPGNIVTNAKGGQSWHNRGVAVDIAFINPDGSVDFNVSEALAKLGEEAGLEWGGRWTSFQDKPHFQLPGLPSNPQNMSDASLLALYPMTTPMTPLNPSVNPTPTPSAIHKDAVAEAIKLGISNGERPLVFATREETIHIVMNAIHYLQKK